MSEALDPTRLLELRLQADGRRGLLPLLNSAEGAVLGERFRIGRLLAAGRQSFVFAATDLRDGGELVVKQPSFDYRHPIRHTRESAAQARAVLEREYEVLYACATGHLPRPVALLRAPPVVAAAARCHALGGEERFLVQERIAGQTVRELALGPWRDLPPAERETAARAIAAGFVPFWEGLHACGWHYSDVSPGNLMIESATGRLRVIDAGGAVPAGEMVVGAAVTPAFTTPRLYDAFRQRQPVPGTLAAVLPQLAKVLHFALTLREPLNGQFPDLSAPELAAYSPECAAALSALLALDAEPASLPAARDALARWLR